MKSRRHLAIKELIVRERITTQEELCEALVGSGFAVTQATVSRDIKDLHLIKIADQAGYRYALPEESVSRTSSERMKRSFRDAVISIDYTEALIVIKTLPGAAQSIALLIDGSDRKGILGTVAGDDTIFVAVKSLDTAAEIVNEYHRLL